MLLNDVLFDLYNITKQNIYEEKAHHKNLRPCMHGDYQYLSKASIIFFYFLHLVYKALISNMGHT